jgi:hypothetical protein
MKTVGMREGAYETLDGYRLLRPRTLTYEEVCQLPPHVEVMIRDGNGPGRPSICSADDAAAILRDLDRTSTERTSNVVEAAVSDAGGCVVTLPGGGVYVELVDGHLSGLLKEGWCGARALGTGHQVVVACVSQPFAIRFRSGYDERDKAIPLKETDVRERVEGLATALAHVPGGRLFEFIELNAGTIMYVDEKPYPWAHDYHALLGGPASADRAGPVVSPGHGTASQLPGGRTIARTSGNGRLRLGDNALLSHFITYALEAEALQRVDP